MSFLPLGQKISTTPCRRKANPGYQIKKVSFKINFKLRGVELPTPLNLIMVIDILTKWITFDLSL